MSSVFEVPQQLALAISLAVAPAGPGTQPGALQGWKSLAQEPALTAPLSAGSQSSQKLNAALSIYERSWLRALKDSAHQPGIGKFARRIFITGSGRHYVPIKAERQRILKLQGQPAIALRVAYDHTLGNIARVAKRIGRRPTAGELYIAYLIGARDAARLIRLAEHAPGAAALDHPALFYAGRRPASAGEIYSRLTRAFGSTKKGLAARHRPKQGRWQATTAVAGLAGRGWTARVWRAQ